MKTYTALTIGPIIETFNYAHKTRELWAASYLFSCLMEKIIKYLQDNNVSDNNFIIPYPNKDKTIKQAGVFPDRLILKSDDGLFDTLQNAVDNAINQIVENCNGKISKDFLQKYLRTYIVETELNNNENVVFTMHKYLANYELQSKYIPELSEEELQFVAKLAESKNFENVFGNKHFPSIIKIATKDLGLDESFYINDDEDDKLWEKIKEKAKEDKEIAKKLKTAHKYIAIVQADGDNVSKLIQSIYEKDPEKISVFSKALSDFSISAAKKIKEWGAEPIYAGGDDLLFFSPVINNGKNIFDLILEIDKIFDDKVNKNEDLKNFITEKSDDTPSMSYGVSITYYKYPMHEALNNARSLLFDKAKKDKKNAIAYKVLKHSGQYFEDVLSKKNEFFNELNKMFLNKNVDMLSSVMYNLETHKLLLKEIAGDKDRLTYFSNNFYNEDIHKNYSDFIKKVNTLINIVYCDYNTDTDTDIDIDKLLNKVFSGLRLIKFLNRKDNE